LGWPSALASASAGAANCKCKQGSGWNTPAMELDLNADGRWAVWALDETRVLLSTHLSPTPPAAMLLACLLWTHTQGPGVMPAAMAMPMGEEAEALGFRVVCASRELECCRSVQLLSIWVSFPIKWTANS